VGKYYGTYDAQLIFDDFELGDLGVVPLFFEHAFYCKKCGSMATAKTCPHSSEDHLFLSGTQVRQLLNEGKAPPPEMTRPEVAWILMQASREQEAEAPVEQTAPAPQPAAAVPERRRMLVIGLDCFEPTLLEKWKDDLPNLAKMMDGGIYGPLESTVPPITVPAWTCMLASKDPGELGIYGFRNRADHSYTKMFIATSRAIKAKRAWEILSEAGRRVALLGVPQTYPPKEVNGVMVTSFLTPSTESQYTYPASLKQEIKSWVGDYVLDVRDFRTEDKDYLLRQVYDMSEKRFRVARRLLRREDWDFFMMVEMGPDRMHHGFWQYMDERHPKHEPGNRYENAIYEYYLYIDREIGELLELVGDETLLMVVSDHGAQAMEGGICFNEWLHQEGYLAFKEEPQGLVPLEKVEIDWSRTKAWGAGGYYGRLFLNVQGREPHGIIPQDQVEAVRDELIAKLSAMTDHKGRPLGTVVFRPEEVYREVKNIPPDLIVYFGNLAWRSVGSVGFGQIYTFENDTGPDDANHAQDGVFILYDPLDQRGKVEKDLHLMDVGPTILERLGLPVPEDMRGKVIR
jgi:predicted AlkP superfamily phosphohydrolase/phosphomutase